MEEKVIGNEHLAYSELIIALAYAVGTDDSIIIDELQSQLSEFNYEIKKIKISSQLIEPNLKEEINTNDNATRINKLMTQGNTMRKENGTTILAQGVANEIAEYRKDWRIKNNKGVAFIIDSLKHEDEVNKLKEIYTSAFYLFAINESEHDRKEYLINAKDINVNNADNLIERDTEEKMNFGQHTKKVFQLADFHLSIKDWKRNFNEPTGRKITKEYGKKLKQAKQPIIQQQITRILDLLFGNPYITPTFDEYAMFMAYSSSLRSADLSRQVGAVIANEYDIISTGANDVPAPNGGQYWPQTQINKYNCDIPGLHKGEHCGYDIPLGRDHTWGFDPNKHEIEAIIEAIIDSFDYDDIEKKYKMSSQQYRDLLKKQLLNSPLKDLTEFNRAVHAEMAAMLSCARTGTSLQGATLYCTTFPCHNCARHAIFAGIKRVVFIEPYLKSKAINLHKDSITINDEKGKVKFEQFMGVGPRRFFDLFSLRLSTGRDIIRKQNGNIISFNRAEARTRCEIPISLYTVKENLEASNYVKLYKK